MPEASRDLTPARLGALLLLAAIVLGGALRFALLAASDFPYNDGGMVLVMAQEVLEQGGRLPVNTSYNTGPGGADLPEAIPFAYPPLPFYLAALPAGLLGLPLIQVQRWLPGLFSLLTIPAFYWLALGVLRSPPRAGFAALAFALALPSFDRVLMGGGLTRAPGALFSLLALAAVQGVYDGRRRPRHLALAAGLCAMAALSHPVYAWFTAYSAILLLVFAPQPRINLLPAVWIAAGALLLTAPWWLFLLRYHGFAPLISAFQTRNGLSLPVALGQLLLFDLTRETFLDVLGGLALFGLLGAMVSQRWLLPAWLLAIFLLERTTPVTFAILPLTMLAADGAALATGALLALAPPGGAGARRVIVFSLVILPFYLLLSTYLAFNPPLLAPGERQAMSWAAGNTPPASRFAVITGLKWWDDPASEWFPALAQRRSLATVQGKEWLDGPGFPRTIAAYDSLQACHASQDSACVDAWSSNAAQPPDYLYVRGADSPLARALRSSSRYQPVYENPAVVIFQGK